MSRRLGPINLGPISIQVVRVYFSSVDMETPVEHQLGIVPAGAVVLGVDRYCRIKSGEMPPASNVLFMVSDTALVNATMLVIAINLSER